MGHVLIVPVRGIDAGGLERLCVFDAIGTQRVMFARDHESGGQSVVLGVQDANERSVNAVAGPPPIKKVEATGDRSAQPSKKALKKSRVTPPPPLHDPN